MGRDRMRAAGSGAREAHALDAGTVRAEVGVRDAPDHAFSNQPHGHPVADAARVLRPELRAEARAARGVGEGTALGHIMTERLLAVDVLAGPEL